MSPPPEKAEECRRYLINRFDENSKRYADFEHKPNIEKTREYYRGLSIGYLRAKETTKFAFKKFFEEGGN